MEWEWCEEEEEGIGTVERRKKELTEILNNKLIGIPNVFH